MKAMNILRKRKSPLGYPVLVIHKPECRPLDLPMRQKGATFPAGYGVINPDLPQGAEGSIWSLKCSHKPPLCQPSATGPHAVVVKPCNCSMMILHLQTQLTLVAIAKTQCFAAVSSVGGNLSHWQMTGSELGFLWNLYRHTPAPKYFCSANFF